MAAEDPVAEAGANDDVKVKKGQVAKAIKALLQVISKRSANTNPLFSEEVESMTVQFSLVKIPERRRATPVMIKLPFPLFGEKSEICFISKSPQKQYKELILQKHPVPGITKVIGIEKLRKNYKQFESKRALADAYDLFLCDKNVIEMMPQILGVTFYRRKLKPPIPVQIFEDAEDPTLKLKQAVNSTFLKMSRGPCIGIRFGRCTMPEEHLSANCGAVIASTLSFLNKYDIAVSSITVQATNCPSLPVWQRPLQTGPFLDLKKYRSEQASSAASDTGASGISDSEVTGSEITSDAGETLSTRDTVSEFDTGSEIDTNGETLSEIDSEADGAAAKEEISVGKGLKKKKRNLDASAAKATSKVSDEAPKKKAKKKASVKR